MVNSFLRRASFRLIPARCLLCLGSDCRDEDLCPACYTELPWLGPHCERCALPLASGSLCGHCLRSAPHFDQCQAAWEYGYPIDRLISRFKYQQQRLDGSLLTRLALDQLAIDSPPDLLAPVPMHWRRRLRRGFNQADVIARHWGAALQIPVFNGLYRQHYQAPQQGLSAHQRQRNLRNAFALRNSAKAAIANKHIAIIDDVVTTAATANSVAVILRSAGAGRISVWCLARTP